MVLDRLEAGRRRSFLPVLPLLGACAASPTPGTVSVEVPVARQGSAPSPAAPAPAPPPEGIQLPEAVACVFSLQAEGRRPSLPMRLAPDGPVFASTGTSDAQAFVGVDAGPGGGAVVEASDDVLLVRGHLAPGDAPLWPRRPFVLGDFLTVRAGTKLAFRGAAPGRIGIALLEARGIDLASPPVSGERPCADVDFVPRRFLAGRAFPASPGEAPARLDAGKRIPLSLLPGRPPVAFLRSDEIARDVVSLEADGASTRIRGALPDVDYFGWIPTADLGGAPGKAAPKPLPRARVVAELGAVVVPKGERIACRAELPLVARVGEASAVVGRLRPGKAVLLLLGTEDLAPIAFDTKLSLAEGADLALRREDVRRACGPADAASGRR